MMIGKGLKQAVSCVIFLALVWTVFLHCTYLFRETKMNTRPQILGFYLEEPDSLDIVFVGPSSVHNYWNAMVAWHEYGITSYSYSVSSMTADGMQYCLREIQKTQDPVVVVVDVRRYLSRYSNGDINESGYRNFFDSLDFDLERLEAVNYVRKLRGISVKDAVTEFIDLIYYHSNRSALASRSNWEMWDNRIENPPYYGSFYKATRIQHPLIHEFLQKPTMETDEASPLNESDERALRDFLTYCGENKIEVLLTASPYIFYEKDLKEFNRIANIAEEYNTPFLNMNQRLDEIDLDYSVDFFNPDHLNIFGMEKYTRYVADYLKEHYAIPDRRDDAFAAAWDELYSKYEEDIKKVKNHIMEVIAGKTQAITNENIMHMTSDAGQWLSLADDENMTVLILMDQKSESAPSPVNEQLLKIYGLTLSILTKADHYFCVYSGKTVSSDTSGSTLSGRFGSRYEDKLTYTLSIGEQSQIMVGNRNYIEGVPKGIHMVAFDNNTYKFVDAVRFTISGDGELHLERVLEE